MYFISYYNLLNMTQLDKALKVYLVSRIYSLFCDSFPVQLALKRNPMPSMSQALSQLPKLNESCKNSTTVKEGQNQGHNTETSVPPFT